MPPQVSFNDFLDDGIQPHHHLIPAPNPHTQKRSETMEEDLGTLVAIEEEHVVPVSDNVNDEHGGVTPSQENAPAPPKISGPLLPPGFPQPNYHPTGAAKNSHLEKYVNAGPRQLEESAQSFGKRMLYVQENLKLTFRTAPECPFKETMFFDRTAVDKVIREWKEVNIEEPKKFHRNKLNPRHQLYDAHYARQFHESKTAEYQSNLTKLAIGVDNLRAKHALMGLPRMDSPEPLVDLGDELFVWGEKGPLDTGKVKVPKGSCKERGTYKPRKPKALKTQKDTGELNMVEVPAGYCEPCGKARKRKTCDMKGKGVCSYCQTRDPLACKPKMVFDLIPASAPEVASTSQLLNGINPEDEPRIPVPVRPANIAPIPNNTSNLLDTELSGGGQEVEEGPVRKRAKLLKASNDLCVPDPGGWCEGSINQGPLAPAVNSYDPSLLPEHTQWNALGSAEVDGDVFADGGTSSTQEKLRQSPVTDEDLSSARASLFRDGSFQPVQQSNSLDAAGRGYQRQDEFGHEFNTVSQGTSSAQEQDQPASVVSKILKALGRGYNVEKSWRNELDAATLGSPSTQQNYQPASVRFESEINAASSLQPGGFLPVEDTTIRYTGPNGQEQFYDFNYHRNTSSSEFSSQPSYGNSWEPAQYVPFGQGNSGYQQATYEGHVPFGGPPEPEEVHSIDEALPGWGTEE